MMIMVKVPVQSSKTKRSSQRAPKGRILFPRGRHHSLKRKGMIRVRKRNTKKKKSTRRSMKRTRKTNLK